MPPVIRRHVGRIDTERLNGVDYLEDTLDLGPAIDLEENVSAWTHER